MSNIVKLELEINVDELKDIINDSKDLNDNEQLFSNLVQFARAKKKINDLLDQIISIEEDAKGLIKSKAQALYGDGWQAIKGKGYKISRSGTGAVYAVLPDAKPPKEFIIVKESLDAKKIEAHIKETGKLPKGIDYNPSRGTALRITVSDDENN